jgi:hypothetical protein
MNFDRAKMPFLTNLYFIFFLFFTFSCQNTEKSSKNALSKEEQEIIAQQQIWDSNSSLFKNITISSQGIVRKFNWGQKIDQIKESVELSEVQPSNGKSYTQYLDETDLNFVDISYLASENGMVSSVVLDIFLEDQKEVQQLKIEFKKHLDAKFGVSQPLKNKMNWLKDKNTQIILEDVSTSKDPGIKLVFSNKN